MAEKRMERLWYKKPARFWHQALPVGNGSTGVMIYGGRRKEKLALNNATLWSGYPKDQTNPDSLRHMNQVRELIFAGKNDEADRLTMQSLCGGYSESFLPLGDLHIAFKGGDASVYRRELDLAQAVHTVTAGGMTRECFASYPDKIAVYRAESKKPFGIKISAKSKLRSKVIVDDALNLMGNAPDHVVPNYLRKERRPVRYNEGRGMGFCLRVQVRTDGTVRYHRKHISVSGAKKVTLLIATATGYMGYDKMPRTDSSYALEQCRRTLNAVQGSYPELRRRHVQDYRDIYAKQSLSLRAGSDMPTDALVNQAKKGSLTAPLVELFYNYGKYLTVSGSREGGQALNLQGIWNRKVRPPWSSNYTVNINTQMNYWGVVQCNLAECIEPYLRLVKEVMQAGKRTARVNYGCGGFACNHNVDLWRKTAPVQGDPAYMYAPLCGVWLANELYGHFKNGALEQYRRDVEEIVTQAAMFVNEYLVLHDGRYVICPSASPEAVFLQNGKQCALDYASAYEMGLVKQLFYNYLEFAQESNLKQDVQEKLPQLFPFGAGKTGLLEWHDDYPIAEKGHRHFSPLYAFYPGRVIQYYGDAKETQWVKALFDYRCKHSKQHIGWSAAWAVCVAARLHDGEYALTVLKSLFAKSIFNNLFDVHQPLIFQIDGNFGTVAGINEMLVYTENNVIELLPALPAAWKTGEVKGMVVNGAEIDFRWENGLVTAVGSGGPVRVYAAHLAAQCDVSNMVTIVESIKE